MESPVVFVLILFTTTFATAAPIQKLQASENPLPVGSNVTLFSQDSVAIGAWLFDNNIVVLIFPGNTTITDIWIDRVTFNSTSSSLTIHSVQLEDSGLYTLLAVNSFRAQLTLSVQVPISNVTLRANATNLVEFNDTAVLTCSVLNGSSLSYVWLKGSSVVTAGGGVQLSDGGATLTMSRVTRYDEGSYRCNVSNSVSHESSLPVYLNISYGPSNISMVIMPMRSTYKTGSNITLSCSAESSPPAMIQWMVDGVSLNQYGPQLQLKRVTESNSGNYQCVFHNTVTSRFSSKSAMIRIVEPIGAVVVNHTGGPVILHESFSLHCEVTGNVTSIQWRRNGQRITACNTTSFDMNNKTLIITQVQFSVNGDYQCQAFNDVSNMTSSYYRVEVNYGPMKPVITGQSMALAGTLETFNCSSASNPPSRISWYYNDSLVANTSDLVVGPLTLNMSGKYICMAFNNITGKNSTAYTMLTVLAPVTMASIKMVSAQAIQNHTFTLTCETSGGVESIIWMYGLSPLYANNTRNFSMDNATLTFDPVMNSDDGNYSCVASNPLSSLSSQIFLLEVYYGPQMPTIMGTNAAKTGDNVTFSCHASSNPPSSYKWFFNDSLVANTSDYVTPPLTEDMSGMYTCMASNNITGKNSTAYRMLTVFAPVIMASIKMVSAQAIQNHTFTLTCETSGGVESIIWMYGLSPLYADNTRNFSMDNATLTFDPVMNSDDGNYSCVASNPLSSLSSQIFLLEVYYGPQMPTIMGTNAAKTGDNVTFSCHASSNPPSSYKWFFNDSLVANTSDYVTPPLTEDMSGMYTCMAFNNITGKNSTAYRMLTVFAPVTMASIKMVSAQAIQNHTFTLTCETSGGVESIIWMYGLSPLYADNTRNFSMDNATLTFDPVMNSDDGNYSCVASNPLSSLSSQIFLLEVYYGPQMPTIMGTNAAKTGDNVTFSCHASSNPPSSYKWFFNDSLVANTSDYVTPPLTEDMSGMYTCMASNNITGKNSTAYRMLTVFAPVTMASIKMVSAQAIQNHTFTLTCETSGGVESIIWMYGLSPLYADNTRNFSMDNATLTFDPVMNSDDGNYSCVASNPLSSLSSQIFLLEVYYGPQMPTIMGTNAAKTGDNVTFSCHASSNPPSSYKWFFNDSLVANTSDYVTPPLTEDMSGMYTCMAFNNITGKNSTAYRMLTVFEAIGSVMIRNNTVPINSENFTLTCNVTGPYDMIYWMKDNMHLKMPRSTADSHMSYYIEKNMLHFTPVTLYSEGTYQCVATNQAGQHKSPKYMLLVNYGPLSVNISGPDSTNNDLYVYLTCYADSRPDCDFHWFLNNQPPKDALTMGSVIIFLPTKETEGNYTCKATNPVTKITMYQTKAFTVAAHASALRFPSQGVLIMMGLFALSVPVLFK